jgi:uncharacterized YkwD family protein
MKINHFPPIFMTLFISLFLFSNPSDKPLRALASDTMQKESFHAKITATKLNLRQGPSLDSPILSVLHQGETVEVYGKIKEWYLVYHPDKKFAGLVHGNFIKEAASLEVTKKETDTKAPSQSQTTPPTPSIPSTKNPIAPPTTIAPNSKRDPIVMTDDEQELFSLVNKVRTGLDLKPLEPNDALIHSARLKSRDMVQKNYFSHQSPTYGSPFDMLRQFKISFKSAGENIAGNQSIKNALSSFMSSESHKKNILNPNFQYMGVGIENSPIYGKIIVQQFVQS